MSVLELLKHRENQRKQEKRVMLDVFEAATRGKVFIITTEAVKIIS